MKAHDYKYHQRLKPKKKGIPLIMGSILHEMLNAYIMGRMVKNYKGKDAGQILDDYEEKYMDLFEEQRDENRDIIGDCERIFQGYLRRWKNDPLTYEGSEEFVATDLADGIRFIGYLDKVATDAQGRRWIVDHKFVRSMPGEEGVYHELQLLMYFWAWERWRPDSPIDGIIWDYARTKAPTEPELLKKGGLSKAKRIDTDAHTYMAAIGRHGLDPADYVDMLQHLEGKEETFFHRIQLPKPSTKMVDEVVEDFRTSALMIQKMKGIAPRSMSAFNCKTCEFRKLCEAEVRGQDANFIKKSEYEQRDEHGDDDDAPEENEIE